MSSIFFRKVTIKRVANLGQGLEFATLKVRLCRMGEGDDGGSSEFISNMLAYVCVCVFYI